MTSTDPSSRLSWSTPPAALTICGIGGLVLAGATFLSNDGPGRLLIGLAALGLLFLTGVGLRQRPRLAIEPGNPVHVVVRGLAGAQRYTPQQILRVRVVNYRRLGRRMPMLEMDVDHDGDERLIIFGRWDLGAHPEDVLEVLRIHLSR
ncbi:PH domain-containing protein [Nocardia seriolae]|uniref:PH domain-containing protein n=1 Tax=Nocardia seriolae TaxID=37332 RepID=UPI0004B71B70|nr:PH domain-containing protein [Nocardia seriolae]MTJ60026.1 PH domain-containing protein [Nocardia seriolae]MTJ70096.1 PH domain-containing protein [Nocardia seriolae]MTJ85028.1 PH domain-containing protein [Nocardia seriolae]MTK29023.1 PH domain-containing protein [Nocardia seriolae]MTK44785.1 PH domain-containing protein [Nocardia seriolae]